MAPAAQGYPRDAGKVSESETALGCPRWKGRQNPLTAHGLTHLVRDGKLITTTTTWQANKALFLQGFP